MHIDHNQFLELLIETSGIGREKVEKQILELIGEINQAVEDGEAYEIEGFGIFSGIGNRILFIPSKELETEINFKYVGMEPIELEEGQVKKEKKAEEDPFLDLQELDAEPSSKRDPFAGLVEDFEDDTPGPEEWGIEAHKEDDTGANKLLSSLMGEEAPETEEESSFDDIFGEDAAPEEEKEESGVTGLDAELSSLMSEEASVISADEIGAGILDDDFSDIFGDEESDNEEESESLELESPEEELAEEESEETEILDEALDELVTEAEEEGEKEETEQEMVSDDVVEEKPEEEIDLDEFDDPFLDLEQELSEEQETISEDIIPVITNISSGVETVKKEEEEPKEQKKEKPKTPKKEPQPAPVWLWLLLVLVLITGTTIGLGYFSVINIPGITPQVASNTNTVVTPPVTPPAEQENTEEQPVTIEPEEVNATQTPSPQEQEALAEVPVSNTTEPVPSDQNKYGMKGVVNEAANDGYTIVLYSLSVEANAFAKQQELTSEDYRALVTPIASERYGTLWRVSIGQFASLTDAAIASEDMDAKFKQSYFIKRIIN